MPSNGAYNKGGLLVLKQSDGLRSTAATWTGQTQTGTGRQIVPPVRIIVETLIGYAGNVFMIIGSVTLCLDLWDDS